MNYTEGTIIKDENYESNCKYQNGQIVKVNLTEIKYNNPQLPNTEHFKCYNDCGHGDCRCNGGATECFTILKKI